MKLLTVTVARDVSTKIATQVFPHELPILELINGAGSVELQDEEPSSYEADPDEEWIRLERKYGVDTDSNMSFVAKVYRHPGELAEAMSDEAPKPRTRARKG